MSALAIHPRHRHVGEHHHLAVLLALMAVAAGIVLVAGDRTVVDDDGTAVAVTASSATPAEAIDVWLAANRDERFPGAAGPYLGTCPTDAPTTLLIGICSSPREDLGDVQLHIVGVYASDWGADLLLEHGDETGWTVAGVSPWPALGARDDGSPWSPLTAITTWWLADDRAAARYGAGAVHLRSCGDAAAVGPRDAGLQQPLLCSTLLESSDTERSYASGLAGAEPDVRITVTRRPDRTWSVTGVNDVTDTAGITAQR